MDFSQMCDWRNESDLFFFCVFMFQRKKAHKQLTVYQELGLSMRSGQGFWKSSDLKI